MSNFDMLRGEWPFLYEPARRAELAVYADPRAAQFYARFALESAVTWMYSYDESLGQPYSKKLDSMLHEPSFKALVGQALFLKARAIKNLGNGAVHPRRKQSVAQQQQDAMAAVRELFHVMFWLARTYHQQAGPPAGLVFEADQVPRIKYVVAEDLEALKAQAAELVAAHAALDAAEQARAAAEAEQQAAVAAQEAAVAGQVAAEAAAEEALAEAAAIQADLDAQLAQVRQELAAAKAANAAVPDVHDYDEAATRDLFIDLMLREAGWDLDDPRDREYAVTGMPNSSGTGFVDYVLWGADGRPLALVEAKRTRRDATAGRQQAKLYADALEAAFGRRPVIFYSNGYEHWMWDDVVAPPRQVAGFFTRDELELAIQRRMSALPLADMAINPEIAGRYYQERAIRRICESFEVDRERRALVVMATGAGKTRTVIALVDVLMRAGWVKRVLFLADRTALVKQAANAFKTHLPDVAPVNLTTDRHTEGRVYVSTYPTMMNLIDEVDDQGRRRFGPGYFDLVVIDEAHRSVFAKYRGIFEYFDSRLVGLTATPKDEVDRNTYRLFELETGVPTDVYGLTEAVADGFLVPPRAVAVPLKFQRQGIRYEELSEDEKDAWDALEWDEDGEVPLEVDAADVNSWLFNADTVDKVLADVMAHGLKVAGGDQQAKTILFAKNQAHADFIAERFDANYPHLRGRFARVISHRVEYAQTLIDDFSTPGKDPQLAISVDMLDTGIDVPEVANLVFFKMVRSKTKFWQMLGRGTRLSPDLFGPGRDKRFFYLFDYCANLEYFSQDVPAAEPGLQPGLGARLFTTRLELLGVLDAAGHNGGVAGTADVDAEPTTPDAVRAGNARLLWTGVAAMNTDNFLVRPHRRTVERFTDPAAWASMSADDAAEAATLAGLPTELPGEDADAKRFDLLALRLQLALLTGDASMAALAERVRAIAAGLQSKEAIPLVAAQMPLILDIQTDEYWQDVTVPMVEVARRRLRGLVQFVDTHSRTPVYVDFEDEMGPAMPVILPGLTAADTSRFERKAAAYLNAHLDLAAVRKLHTNEPLTADDLTDLERAFLDAGIGGPDDLARAAADNDGLGLFVRSIVGLDQQAAKAAMGEFINASRYSANQIHFVNLVVDYLCRHGQVPIKALYSAPFTDVVPQGPEGIFTEAQVDDLVARLHAVRDTAVAS